MLPFHRAVESDFAHLNRMIIDELHSDVPLVENIGHYIVEGGGKRLRPVSVLLVAAALGNSGTEAVRLATVIEFIHTATLLHDDVVDESDRRRGRQTANDVWGNSAAVLVGDFLYSRAFQLMVRLANPDIMRVLADTTNTIAEGEVQQLINAGNADTSEADYLNVVNKKTAVLFEAATKCAAHLSQGTPELCSAMGRYGRQLGLAFQLQDDVLDYTGDADALGKNLGDDLAEGKPTLPLIYTIRNGSAEASSLIREAIETRRLDSLDQVVDAVRQCGGLEYTQSLANRAIDLAIEEIGALPESGYRDTLVDLAHFALNRDH